MIEASGTNEELLLATIDLEKVSEVRAKIPYLTDLKKVKNSLLLIYKDYLPAYNGSRAPQRLFHHYRTSQ